MYDTPKTAETRLFWESLHRDAFKPNAERLAEIIHDGGVAALVHNMGEVGRITAESLGWDGRSQCWKLSRTACWAMTNACREVGDTAAAEWFASSRPGRVLVLSGDGSICMNVSPRGLSIEPGTLDIERSREALS